MPNATVANTRKALFQVKGGGIFNQWVSLRLEPRNVETSGGKTTVRVSALKYNEDYALRFRIMITDADGIRHQAQMTVNWRI
ncbi:MAG: hypothetical protein F4Z94_03580 [Chloroflexi bacterium]|nr:hypothetical protein [Chloroflexota bacterium]